MRHHLGKPRRHAAPAARLHHHEDRQRREAQHDQEELQHFVVNRAGQSAEKGVNQNDGRRKQHGRGEAPVQHQFETDSPSAYIEMPDENTVITANVTRVQSPRLLVESQLQIFRHAARAASIIERHHEDADEQHGRHRADPIKMRGHDAVLRAGSAHADHFLRAKIRGDERQAGDPDRDRASGGEEIGAGCDLAFHDPADG